MTLVETLRDMAQNLRYYDQRTKRQVLLEAAEEIDRLTESAGQGNKAGMTTAVVGRNIPSSGDLPNTPGPAHADQPPQRLCPAHFGMHDVLCSKGCGDTCIVADPEKVAKMQAGK